MTGSLNTVSNFDASSRRVVIVAAILILTIIGTFLRGPYWDWYWPWQSWPIMPRKF